MRFETLLAVAAGAFAYHMYARVQNLEELLGQASVVHLGGLLDKADGGEDTEVGKFKFGFHV